MSGNKFASVVAGLLNNPPELELFLKNNIAEARLVVEAFRDHHRDNSDSKALNALDWFVLRFPEEYVAYEKALDVNRVVRHMPLKNMHITSATDQTTIYTIAYRMPGVETHIRFSADGVVSHSVVPRMEQRTLFFSNLSASLKMEVPEPHHTATNPVVPSLKA